MHAVAALGRERDLRVGGVNAGQDVLGAQRLQHGPQRVIQRQHVVRAAARGQGQHGFALQGRLRQQIQKHLEHAAVGRLVDRGGHHQHAGLGHLVGSGHHGGVAKVGQQQGLGRQVADVDAVHQGAAGVQALRHGIEQGGRAGALGGAAGNQQGGHGVPLLLF